MYMYSNLGKIAVADLHWELDVFCRCTQVTKAFSKAATRSADAFQKFTAISIARFLNVFRAVELFSATVLC